MALSAAVLVPACSGLNTVPEFDPADSFAAFVASDYGLDENKGKLVIPVQIASIDPIKTTVSYKIVEGTAKKGVDFNDTNSSAVLTFDGKARTQDIVINVVNHEGDYTGDLTFSIELVSATGINIGAENKVNVSIYDLDHPLAPILGEYSASSVCNYDGPSSWTMTMFKDAKDIKTVWIQGLTDVYKPGQLVYATVLYDDSGEETSDHISGIVIPAGQFASYSASYDMTPVGCYITSQGIGYAVEPLYFAYKNGTFTFDPQEDGQSMGILVFNLEHTSPAGWWSAFTVPPTYVKK